MATACGRAHAKETLRLLPCSEADGNAALMPSSMPSCRILLVVPHYSRPGGSPTMADELAGAFADAGHDVQVIALPWDAPADGAINRRADRPGVDVIRAHPVEWRVAGRLGARLSKWGLSSFLARRKVAAMLHDREFDLLVSGSPAVSTAGIVRWALKRFRPRSFVHVVDFFPFHQHALGLVPGGPILAAAKAAETAMLRRFDVVGCMSPANIAYLERHYRLPATQRHCLLPVFGDVTPPSARDREAVRRAHDLPVDRPIAVFGGQLTDGRGVPEILEAARLSHAVGDDLTFLMIGRGRLEHLVEAYLATGRGNLRWIEGLPREDYLSVAAACDVGMVVTVGDVDVPTFPSKTIDYLRAGLPIAAAVEDSTDYGDFIVAEELGHAVRAGDPVQLIEAVRYVLATTDRQAFGDRARRVLAEMFDVRSTASTILRETGLASSPSA